MPCRTTSATRQGLHQYNQLSLERKHLRAGLTTAFEGLSNHPKGDGREHEVVICRTVFYYLQNVLNIPVWMGQRRVISSDYGIKVFLTSRVRRKLPHNKRIL